MALTLLRRSLAIRERALGTAHPDVAIGLYNLAEMMRFSGAMYGGESPLEMRALFLRALAIRQQTYGPESAMVADALVRLAIPRLFEEPAKKGLRLAVVGIRIGA